MPEEIFFFEEPESPMDTLTRVMGDLLSLSPKWAIPLLSVIWLGNPQTSLAEDLYQQPIIVTEEGRPLQAIEGVEVYRVWNRLQELSLLPEGWDGPDSKSMDMDIVGKMKQILLLSEDQYLKDWVLFPDARGYLYLDYTHDGTMAGITLMKDVFVYFIIKNGATERGNNQLLVADNVISVFKSVQSNG